MNFELTPEQRELVQRARNFAEEEFPPLAKECDRDEKFPMSLWKKAAGLGFMGIYIDKQYGGLGLGLLGHAMVVEEFWRVDPGLGCIHMATFGAEVIQSAGTTDQKRRYLPLVSGGEAIMTTAITEPDAGSDIFSGRSFAKKADEGYLLNGSKMFISNGSVADIILVFCITDEDNPNPYARHSFLLVDAKSPGFEAEKLTGKMGIRAANTAALSFQDVFVSEENLIGEKGNGFRQVMECFNLNRVIAAGQGVGVAQGALESAISYVKGRKRFGKPLADSQGIQFKVADMAAMVESARCLYRAAAWGIDNKKPNVKLVSIAKLIAGEIAVKVSGEALQLHGRSGWTDEHDIERFYRAAKIVEIYEGTKEIEKVTIAREVLGR